MKRRLFGAASAFIVSVCSTSGALAQQASPSASKPKDAPATVGEIIVTAQRTSEKTINIPIAIQAVTGDTLAKQGITSLANLGQVTPGLEFVVAGTQPLIGLRGSSGDIQGIAGDPAIQVSLDGVPYASQEYMAAGFLDVSRVEVLRGPQGTVAGRNSTGGAINIISNHPTSDFSGALNATYGNFDARAADGFVSGPLVDGVLNARLAFKVNYRDGILDNQSPANPDHFGGDAAERSGRFSLEYAPPNSRLTAYFSAEAYRNETTGPADVWEGTSIPTGEVINATDFLVNHQIVPILPTNGPVYGENSLKVNEPYLEGGPRINLSTQGFTLRLKYDLANDWVLTSVTGYRAYNLYARIPADAALSSAWAGQEPEFARQVSEELNLTGKITPDLDFLIGGLYLNQTGGVDLRVDYYPTDLLGLSGFSGFHVHDDQDLTSQAGFGQVRWRFLPGFELTVGGRYTLDEKSFAEAVYLPASSNIVALDNEILGYPTPVKKDFNAFTPRVALDYKPVPNVTLYASYAEGYKAGGFNVAALLSDHEPNPFNPEKNKTAEVGVKTRWFGGALTGNVDVFDSRTDNLQVQFTTSVGQVVANAASAHTDGVEMEFTARPVSGLKLGLNATYLSAAFDKYCPQNGNRSDLYASYPTLTDAQCGLPAGTSIAAGSQNDAGEPLSRAPKWSGNASAAYTWDFAQAGDFVIEANLNFTSKIYFTAFHEEDMSQDGYGLLDLRGTYEPANRHWYVAAFIRNLTDKRYLTEEVANPTGVAQLTTTGNPATFVAGSARVGTIGDPRTFGVTVGYRF